MGFSTTDIYNNGDYLTKNPTWDDDFAPWKAAMVNRLIGKNDIKFNSVVEVGCGAGGILEYLQKQYPTVKNLKGYDISEAAINLANQKKLNNISFFNEDFLALPHTETADLLLCIDVVEHIDDFYGFLQKLKPKGKQFIFHIPLDLCCRTILKPHVLLTQRQLVGHIHYFSEEMVAWALKDTGYQIMDAFFTKPIIDEEPAKGFKATTKKILRNFSFQVSPHLSAKLWGGYSLMIWAK